MKYPNECKICEKDFAVGTKSWVAIQKIGKCMDCHLNKQKRLK